jgi:cysteinyl-tRNA synthetase
MSASPVVETAPTARPTPAPSAVSTSPEPAATAEWPPVRSWVLQLSNYKDNRLDEIAATSADLAVVDLARDGAEDYFTPAEIAAVRATGKVVLAHVDIGAIESQRPEWSDVDDHLKLGPAALWPGQTYIAYWDASWWDVVQRRVDQALAAGFDGIYLNKIMAYEEIPTDAAGTYREDLAEKMVELIARTSTYAKMRQSRFFIVAQNSPELRTYDGYLDAVDGLAIESLYVEATDRLCDAPSCEEKRRHALAIQTAGKIVLTIDYARQPGRVVTAMRQSRADGFVPYVTVPTLDTIRTPIGTR